MLCPPAQHCSLLPSPAGAGRGIACSRLQNSEARRVLSTTSDVRMVTQPQETRFTRCNTSGALHFQALCLSGVRSLCRKPRWGWRWRSGHWTKYNCKTTTGRRASGYRMVFQESVARGGGGIFGGKIPTHLQFFFGAGPSDTENFNTPNPWFLVDKRVRAALVGPNFEQYQLIREK